MLRKVLSSFLILTRISWWKYSMGRSSSRIQIGENMSWEAKDSLNLSSQSLREIRCPKMIQGLCRRAFHLSSWRSKLRRRNPFPITVKCKGPLSFQIHVNFRWRISKLTDRLPKCRMRQFSQYFLEFSIMSDGIEIPIGEGCGRRAQI